MEWNKTSTVKRNEIISNLSKLVKTTPNESISKLMDVLNKGIITKDAMKNQAGFSGQKLEQLMLLLKDLNNDSNLALPCIQTALNFKKQNQHPEPLLCHTGPIQFSGNGRSTSSIIEEMVKEAEKSITIIEYQISPAGKIMSLISQKIEEGKRVRFVIDSGAKNLSQLEATWRGLKRPDVYTRKKRRKDGIHYKIHAKTIVVDSSVALITSANLTWHGLSKNFEIGVRIKKDIPRDIELLVDELIENKYLVKYD